ncbi:hypothetical protein [Desulfonatronum lacustre]|uniref:hypothetical protein n=1 Tax=Desulfonatronum lacustre TaxID=66849 RepID=UPI0012EBA9BC|nr:hypothetical protein [Desulfonatronum lacustre]
MVSPNSVRVADIGPRTPVYSCLGNTNCRERDCLLARNSLFPASSADMLSR